MLTRRPAEAAPALESGNETPPTRATDMVNPLRALRRQGVTALRRTPMSFTGRSIMNYHTIGYSVVDGILTVLLDRPNQLNAFTTQMADELEDAFHQASVDDEVRAIVVTGSGRAFCAGMDLSVDGNVFGLDESQSPDLTDLTDRFEDPVVRRGVRDTGGRVTLAVFKCTKPVIAAINGAAVGIGATMTLAMDVRLASDKAQIGFVFGRLGIVSEACSTWFLPRIVGVSQALEWMYSADILTADEAKVGGLVKSVHPAADLLTAAYALAHRFTENRSPVATALIRQMLYRNSAQPHPKNAHLIESLAMFYTSIGDGKEGVAAFREKRRPRFQSRTSEDMPPFYPWT
jgi:enoyl-CoA hydratase/carnithine racemase